MRSLVDTGRQGGALWSCSGYPVSLARRSFRVPWIGALMMLGYLSTFHSAHAASDWTTRGTYRAGEGAVLQEGASGDTSGNVLRARLTWRMPQRFNADAYDADAHRYDRRYIHPEGWSVILDACGSTPAHPQTPIETYAWHIVEERGRYNYSSSTAKCKVITQADRGASAEAIMLAERSEPLSGSQRAPLRQLRPAAPDTGTLPGGDDPIQPPPPVDPEWDPLPKLPRLGTYQVSLTVTDKLGRTDRIKQSIEVRDYLIVLIGDSYAAGQGNPQVPGKPWEDALTRSSPQCETTKIAKLWVEDIDQKLPMDRPARWIEPFSYRSYLSGHARAALEIERDDPHTSVTFLSFATSGATTLNLLSVPQEQYQAEKFGCRSAEECGQLREVRDAVGGRHIDALLVSTGGNDVGFSDVLTTAVKGDLYNSRQRQRTEQVLQRLFVHYRDLNEAIRNRLNVGRVYITGYPTDIFSGRDGETTSGCGIFGTSILRVIGYDGVGRLEAKLMKRLARELNGRIHDAAQTHGWHFIPVGDGFTYHGYCTGSRSYYRFAEDSCRMQGDVQGTMHPNVDGHHVYGRRVYRALRDTLGRPPGGGVIHPIAPARDRKVQ